ncbi:NAD-dependent epimerase/dehydratase family protein [Sphingomonas immobilis]|uniref:NAD(P)-dependent oxidoreductase n=1 Tax=Sphingomonas immobilis TaxID=3063997 RepID=A0ABT8ZWP7_9SPHN|nr:NAD(P)-dependent oxidoreductase [Sphingomonas sp. CA1-15]MDO7841974.1 NAD(P)-dependent oxidoreductase [Sphingomonas sp. CA1-15]
MSILAITGGTGFVGKRLIDRALADGHQVRALTRRAQAHRAGVTWIEGALDTPDALARLMEGAEAVIHVAGVLNVPTRADFAAGNIAGTQAVVDAATAADVRRFVHVSSLAAREPQLSLYGWSKHGAEEVVEASSLDWTMVRPPAVYGPGDMDMRDMFRMAKHRLALTPPAGRLSVIHVDDLVRLLLVLVATDPGRIILEPDDGTPGGWTHRSFARALGVAVGRGVMPIALPRALMNAAASADKAIRRRGARLTHDRVAYFCHPDWASVPERRPDPALWRPEIATPDGLAQTAAWYRANGLL